MQTLSTATCATLHRAVSADCTLKAVPLRFSFVENLVKAWFEARCLDRLYYDNIPVLLSGFGLWAGYEIALLLPRRTPSRREVAPMKKLIYRQIVRQRLRVCAVSLSSTWYRTHALGTKSFGGCLGLFYVGVTCKRVFLLPQQIIKGDCINPATVPLCSTSMVTMALEACAAQPSWRTSQRADRLHY